MNKELPLTIKKITVQGMCAGVYFLYQNNELVYIGKSWNCFLGVAEQTRKDSKRVFDSWSYTPVDDVDIRNDTARILIAKHKPRYNTVYARPYNEKAGSRKNPSRSGWNTYDRID